MFPKLSLKQLIGMLILAAVFFACLPGALNSVPMFVLIVAAVASVVPIMIVHSVVYMMTSLVAEREKIPSVVERPLDAPVSQSNDSTKSQNPG